MTRILDRSEAGATVPPAPERGPTGDRPIPAAVWRLAWVIVFGAFMGGLDTSLTNVGLHAIGTDLHAGLDRVQWVSTGYLVAFAVSLPICGWLGRRVGVGRLWLAMLGLFTAASGLCAAAPTAAWLVAARVAQGLAAGLLIPAGQTILGQAVGPKRLGRVMATLGIAVTLAPILGPVAGALLLQAGSWRWLFLVNLPIGALGLLAGLHVVPRGDPNPGAGHIDLPGLGLVSTGLPMVAVALTRWGSTGAVARPAVFVPLLLGAAALLAFVLRSLRTSHPVTDLRLFGNSTYAAGTLAATAAGALMFGAGLLFPLYFQVLRGHDVVQTGLLLLALGGGTAAALPLTGRLTDRHGGDVVALAGTLLATAAALAFSLLGNPDLITIEALLAVFGAAIALAVVPPAVAAYASVRPDQLPDATTQVNIVQRVGGALGGALFAATLARNLPHGPAHAFHTTLWWLTAACVLALAGAALLWRTQRRAVAGTERIVCGQVDPPSEGRS